LLAAEERFLDSFFGVRGLLLLLVIFRGLLLLIFDVDSFALEVGLIMSYTSFPSKIFLRNCDRASLDRADVRVLVSDGVLGLPTELLLLLLFPCKYTGQSNSIMAATGTIMLFCFLLLASPPRLFGDCSCSGMIPKPCSSASQQADSSFGFLDCLLFFKDAVFFRASFGDFGASPMMLGLCHSLRGSFRRGRKCLL